jgi:hypothetical protein
MKSVSNSLYFLVLGTALSICSKRLKSFQFSLVQIGMWRILVNISDGPEVKQKIYILSCNHSETAVWHVKKQRDGQTFHNTFKWVIK